MSNDTLSTADDTVITDKLIPIDLDKVPIKYSGNPAELEGVLYEVGRYYKRCNLFQPLFEQHASAQRTGTIATPTKAEMQTPNGVWMLQPPCYEPT